MQVSTLRNVSLGTSLAGAALNTRGPSKVTSRGLVSVYALQGAPKKSAVGGNVLDFAKSLPGISQPFPDIFDPVDLLGNANAKADPINEVKRWRESEITHGRVAMLASLGFILQEQILGANAPRPFPHVQGPAINHFQQVETQGAVFWLPLLFIIALAESYRVSVGWENPSGGNIQGLKADYTPGDLGFDPLGLYPTDPDEQYDLKTKELNNGRLAMIAIAAFVAQELKVEKPIFANGTITGTNF